MDLESLKESLLSVDEGIVEDLANRLTHPYAECKNFGRRLWGLITMYRSRAILRFLVDADIPAFFADLNREALTYRTFLEAYHAKLDIPPVRINASNHSPLACAIAAGNFALCSELDRLMPRDRGKGDDEEAYAFTTMLRALAVHPKEEASAFAVFEKECGESRQLEHLIAATNGLLEQEAKIFKKGLTQYLNSFADLDFGEQEELDPGEDIVSIEGLAFLQLAHRRNFEVKFEHKMTPRVLQSPPKKVPSDGYPPWPG